MKLRAPAYPLITVDPYFNVWSRTDVLTDDNTVHWTDKPNEILGTATIDGAKYRIIGSQNSDTVPAMKQTSVDCSAFSTTYTFEESGVRLTLIFSSPLLLTDLYLLSRPVSYLEVRQESLDGKKHAVSVNIAVSEAICMNRKGDDAVLCEQLFTGKYNSVKMGTKSQKILSRDGDDLRIEWGYFYLTSEGSTDVYVTEQGVTYVSTQVAVKSSALISFAYDDLYSIEYFHTKLKSYWNKDGASILDEIAKAHADYKSTMKRCNELADKMFLDAVRAGGEQYAELLELAYRQTIAAHKLVLDENGEVLWISKECFSNGCAATVDVSYPSIPLFLLYNPELVKGMMRPIYRYARSDEWTKDYNYDFAPHDAGRYPLLNGQKYGYLPELGKITYQKQMPVEECGNMLVMEAAVAVATGDTSFAAEHMDILETWVGYLIENGSDPANQLCTDDFAGHLAHNCNLSLKAIMGIAGLGILYGMSGKKREEKKYIKLARDMALDWAERAANGDGSYRLAFDRPGTFSMKYNAVWDKLFGTKIFAPEVLQSEISTNFARFKPYGMPLDNRADYTKSDWLVWTATLCRDQADFERFIEPLWNAYNFTKHRVPMTDWYDTITAEHYHFQNRTVQGGLFIKMLEASDLLKL